MMPDIGGLTRILAWGEKERILFAVGVEGYL
jgi:hypothetical protein